jgi:uncharacterized iron-regulated membrane protein
MNEPDPPVEKKPWPDYRAVWRWHFYAGVFCIPFVLVLAASGSIYLFKTEIESWIDRPYDHLAVTGKPASAADQIRAALDAAPGSTFQSYEVPQAADSAARVLVNREGATTRVYVHPESLKVLGSVVEEQRLMRVLFKLHGELLVGNRGSALVELAASWAIIMILTGLVLWWPRGARGAGGVVYPRLGRGSRIFWRDIHGVSGFWISGLALFLLLSGLPWAKFWGDYLKNARRLTGAAVAQQDWTNGSSSANPPRAAAADPGEHSMHNSGSAAGSGTGSGSGGGGRRRRGGGGATPADLTPVDRIVATVRPLGLLPPVLIAAPSRGSSEWSAKSMTPNRPYRVDLTIDGATGEIKSRKDFRDSHVIDRIVGTGIAAHEGRLFGLPNQLLGVITAVGLILLCVSSVVLWWGRRESGVLGAPKVLASPRFSLGLLVLVVLLGLYLPMFGASLIAVLVLEWTLLRRIPRIRDWLGLSLPRSKSVPSTA